MPQINNVTLANKRMTVSINPATDIGSFKVKVGTEEAKTLTTSAMPGKTGEASVTFVDAGSDKKVSSGDYFTWTVGTGTADTTVDILWVNGDTSQVVATFTVPGTPA